MANRASSARSPDRSARTSPVTTCQYLPSRPSPEYSREKPLAMSAMTATEENRRHSPAPLGAHSAGPHVPVPAVASLARILAREAAGDVGDDGHVGEPAPFAVAH